MLRYCIPSNNLVLYRYCIYFQYWKDELLKWNASQYNGVTKLQFSMKEIWHPDITLYNE